MENIALMTNYQEEDFDKFRFQNSDISLLLVTATNIETDALHQHLKSLRGKGKIVKTYKASLTYYIGVFGKYKAVHVQCGMGSIARDGSLSTVKDAMQHWQPKVVLMVGIAFGVNEAEQSIGDVLVSEAVIPYNPKRVGEKATIPRGLDAPANKLLINRFKNAMTWEYLLPTTEKAKKIVAPILSGEELIDNLERRNELIKENPTAKGGEMEGAGLYASVDGEAAWIIVKGICDFADGHKGTDKDKRQRTAAEASISLCLDVFDSESAFKDIGLLTCDRVDEAVDFKKIKLVLFDVYDKSMRDYYLKRDIDDVVLRQINLSGIWLYGASGVGKTNLILRNLIESEKKYIFISLASCIGNSVDSCFQELYSNLVLKLDPSSLPADISAFPKCSKQINLLLEKHNAEEELFIFIDEIPISDDALHDEFVKKMQSILVDKQYNTKLSNIKYILSSIKSPTEKTPTYQSKVHEFMKFKEVDTWAKPDLVTLIELISKELTIDLHDDIKGRIINSSISSPRLVKKFMRNLLALRNTDMTPEKILIETERELKNI